MVFEVALKLLELGRWQVSERGGLRVQDGFFARICIDRLGAAVQVFRDAAPGVIQDSALHALAKFRARALYPLACANVFCSAGVGIHILEDTFHIGILSCVQILLIATHRYVSTHEIRPL